MLKKLVQILMVFFLPLHFAMGSTSLVIEGVDGKLKQNIDAFISSIDEQDYSTSLRFQSQLQQNISVALKALGYYQPDIDFTVDQEKNVLTVVVTPGDPVLLAEVDIQILGAAQNDEQFSAIVNNSGLTVGSVLEHNKYDSLKSKLRNLSLANGYFDAEFIQSAIRVSPETKQAFIALHFESGIRYKYGVTNIEGSQIELDRVRSLLPYKQGEPYSVSDVGLLNQRLSNTDWFSSVLVQPDLSKIGQGDSLPMDVVVAPQSKNQIETGIGYSTDVGVRGLLKWNKPWINSQGHSFDSSLSLSSPEQSVVLGYQIPLEDVLNEYYRFQYGMKYEDNNDTESLEAGAAVERHWVLDSGWHRRLFLRYVHEDFVQGAQDDDLKMFLPGFSFSKTRSSAGSMPMKGYKHSITLEGSDKPLLAQDSLLRVLGRSTLIGSYGENNRGIARAEFGINLVENIEDIPPSLRFFAGGDTTLRGYSYESISPEDETGSLIGAKYIATSSLEYQRRVIGDWWLASFVDYGDAWSDNLNPKTGVGFGVRWASPVGPIRLDLAWGLDNSSDDQFRIHFSLGPDL